MPRRLLLRTGAGTAAALLLARAAAAHTSEGMAGGLASGFLHPIQGLDHVIAMVAVGLWGGQLGRPALWLLPVAFPMVMALGGAAGARGLPLPGVEIGIAMSGIVLGVMVAGALRPALPVALALVGIFAVFHGHAHGTELPGAANPLAYGVGFVASTGLLHLAGIAVGLLVHVRPAGPWVVRGCGAAIAAGGVLFLLRQVVGA